MNSGKRAQAREIAHQHLSAGDAHGRFMKTLRSEDSGLFTNDTETDCMEMKIVLAEGIIGLSKGAPP